jgi:hypothetical protein
MYKNAENGNFPQLHNSNYSFFYKAPFNKKFYFRSFFLNTYTFPPYPYLTQVLDHCPRAGATYLALWRNQDENGKIYTSKNDVKTEYLRSWTQFCHDIFLLFKEGLLSYKYYDYENGGESSSHVIIELVGYGSEDIFLC